MTTIEAEIEVSQIYRGGMYNRNGELCWPLFTSKTGVLNHAIN